jgi:hypothetical protein
MASHYVSSSISPTIALYGNKSTTSRIIETLTSSAEIVVLKENEGQNCEFHFVSSSTNQGYILKEFIYRLPDTPESAPFVCYVGTENTSYVPPEWYLLAEDRPYIDQATLEYCTCVTYNSLSLRGISEQEIIKQGIKQLCKFYNKAYSDDAIETYMSYYLFARIADTYIPFRKFMRVKYLVSIPRKYFDALPDALENQLIAPLQRDLTKANFILKINLKEKTNLFKNLINLLSLYQTDIFFSNSTLVFNQETIIGEDELLQNSIVKKVDFKQKRQNVINFEQRLDELLSLNGFPISLDNNDLANIEIHLLLNEDCNILYDVAVSRNGSCLKLRKGIEFFLKTEPVSDPTTINFVRNIYAINSIQKCKVPWYEFTEIYFYPSISVLQPVEDSNLTSKEVFDNLYSFFQSQRELAKNRPILTLEETIELTKTINEFRNPKNFLNTTIPFYTLIDQGSTTSPRDLEKTLEDLDKSIDESPLAKEDIYLVNMVGPIVSDINGYYYVSKIGNIWRLGKQYLGNTEIIKLDTENTRVEIIVEGYPKEIHTLFKVNKADYAKSQIDKGILFKVYEFLNKIGFCKLTNVGLGCLMSLARTILSPIEIKTILEITELTNFDYEKMINDIIPYLPKEQQQLVYEQLLIEIGCLNEDALRYILKMNLTLDEYRSLELQSASYDQIVKEVAKKMSMSVN